MRESLKTLKGRLVITRLYLMRLLPGFYNMNTHSLHWCCMVIFYFLILIIIEDNFPKIRKQSSMLSLNRYTTPYLMLTAYMFLKFSKSPFYEKPHYEKKP